MKRKQLSRAIQGVLAMSLLAGTGAAMAQEPVRIGVATSRPNSVSLRFSSALMRMPRMENMVHTAKFTAKAMVLRVSTEICFC